MELFVSLNDILKKTFKNSDIPEDITELKMGAIDEWDSLGNFNLILAVESYYKIQFEMDEIEKINSVSEIEEKINNALP